ncbi:MAG: FMN-binding negative transcriptional regulator [Minwuia sp.]|nr:FMN-binding negative transcriptional regulator [Minwuia sp.]
MYRPKHFSVDDTATCHDLIEGNEFGLLVTVDADGAPFGTHLPFVLDRQDGPNGTLLAHVARANPQWRDFGRAPVLAVFSGPHAYVSPTMYASSPNVPTWNYAVVHAYGTPRVMEDEAEVSALMRRLSSGYEGAKGWQYDSTPQDYRAGMQKGIVAFRIPIERLEGKWKMSQNRTPEDRAGVRNGLAASGDAMARAVSGMIPGDDKD